MRNEELLEQCLQAISQGHELPPDVARYLARHPEQRAQVEELLFTAQQVSRLPSAELTAQAQQRMQARLALRLGFDPVGVQSAAHAHAVDGIEDEGIMEHREQSKPARFPISKLRYAPPPADDPSEARIREAFQDLTPDDIRRYIGVRGEDYLYYRQRLPGWEPVFAFLAFVLRGFKRLEKLAAR